MHSDVQAVLGIADDLERAREAGHVMDVFAKGVEELARIRRESIEELLRAGKTQTELGKALDISRARIGQLLKQGPAPERAFLGSGKLTVAIGGKQEAGRHDPGDMVSAETFAAYETLAELARTLGLDTTQEVVPPPGLVHLNRPDLVVMTSPRLLPFLSQIMEADPHLRFGSDDQGWYLVDLTTGTKYRSPRDSGEPADYGYIGRLPRPDGKGNFLYLAGTHAQGTLGAARYLADNITDLYRDLKTKRFSLLISCRFDETNPRSILTTERISPIYRHEGS